MKLIEKINKNSVLFQEPKHGMILECHPTFLKASDELRKAVVNGCGPGSWKYDVVPDHPAGFDFTWPCNSHDWDYFLYGIVAKVGVKGKQYADKRARHNWGDVILQMPKPWWVPGFLKRRWRRRSHDIPEIYYLAVKNIGNGAYFKINEKTQDVLNAFRREIEELKLAEVTL